MRFLLSYKECFMAICQWKGLPPWKWSSNGTALLKGNIMVLIHWCVVWIFCFLKDIYLENYVSFSFIVCINDEFSYLMTWSLMASKWLVFFFFSLSICIIGRKIISRLITSVLIGIYWRFTTLGLKVPFGHFINMSDFCFTERNHYLTVFYYFSTV